ncbi:MAG: DUF3427 domain-containing protein, partial [Rhodospirillaceae bacterium]
IYMSKNRRTLESPDVRSMREHRKTGMRMPLFVKKSDDEGDDFYYLGDLTAVPEKFIESSMPGDNNNKMSVVKMEFVLDRPIELPLYRYLTEI